MLAQDLLIVMRTVLAAAIAVEDAALGRRSEGDGHLQGPDCQIALHTVADGQPNGTPEMQVEERAVVRH